MPCTVNVNKSLFNYGLDTATGSLEIAEMKTKSADVVANVAETTWFTRYPWPEKVICGKEDYNVKRKLITACNPASNVIVERAHHNR